MAVPVPLNGSEIRHLKKVQKRLTTIEMNFFFFRTAAGNRFGHRRTEEILEELKVELADEKLRKYKSSWLRHVTRMNNSCQK